MPLITGWSQRVLEGLRHFSLEQHREIDTFSLPVRVTSGKCQRCGFEVELEVDTPADTLRAITMTHELSWETGKRCGGQVAFTVGEGARA
jgi:hypothetical protein